jgi:hypothetical protein
LSDAGSILAFLKRLLSRRWVRIFMRRCHENLSFERGIKQPKSCLYEFEAETLAAPSRPLWEAEIDWARHQGLAELKVTTAGGVSLEEALKSESRSEATGHMVRNYGLSPVISATAVRWQRFVAVAVSIPPWGSRRWKV